MLPAEPVQIGIVTTLLVALGYLWLLTGRGTWYDRLSERLLFGIPWGTVVCVTGVVLFYLFAQSGLTHWNSPVTLPFRSWSYFYPLGLLTSGFAHASPGHLTGNMLGTVVLAPLVEYAWGHYPRQRADGTYQYPPPGKPAAPLGDGSTTAALSNRPWVRALVIFPIIVVLISLVTSVFAFGWSLGFSGTVFAFGGFAVVYLPLATIIAMVAFSGTATVYFALLDPVVRATAEAGSSGPPSWWGVNVQAHLLGFLLGAILALTLLHYRNESRRPLLIFSATLLFGLTRQLYIFTDSPEEDVFLQLRGVGVIFVLGLAIVLTATVAADRVTLSDRIREISWIPTMRLVSLLWVGAVGVVLWAVWSGTIASGSVPVFGIGTVPVLFILLLYPFIPAESPSRIGTQLSRRDFFMFALIVVVVVVALPSVVTNYAPMADDPVPDGETLSIEGYEVTYAEGIQHGRIGTNESGVVVVNEQRAIWIAAADKSDLSDSGEVTVPLGGVGWRETVTATREGWNVVGNDSAYVVDLRHDGETIRAFESAGEQARAQIANKSVSVEPGGENFRLNVTRSGVSLGTAEIPAVGEQTRIGTLRFETADVDGTASVFVRADGTRVLIAEAE